MLRTVVWERHPDILAARNSAEQARINLRLAEITPIPDIYLYSALQKDYTDRFAGGELQHAGGHARAVLRPRTAAASCKPKDC